MKETDEMRDARHALELLSATDPAASANMMRHVAALSIMLLGRRQRPHVGDEPQIVGGFRLFGGDHQIPAAATRRSGIDQVYLAFDVDDAAGPPVGLGVFRKQGDEVAVYGLCRLWSPADGGRAVIVPSNDGEFGHFASRSGCRLRQLNGLPADDLMPGFRRAAARTARLLASPDLRDAQLGGYMHVVRNEGQDLLADTFALAA